jgi:hypothetical protein
VLVIAPDIESAAAWAERLDGARLDSGAPDATRRAAWFGAGRGRPRVVVGTRSALLVPLPPPAALALLDEADSAHKPPGAPRLHSRELLVERAGARAAGSSSSRARPPWRPGTTPSREHFDSTPPRGKGGRAFRLAGDHCRRHARHSPQPSPHPAPHASHRGRRAPRPSRGAGGLARRRRAGLRRVRRGPALSRLRCPPRARRARACRSPAASAAARSRRRAPAPAAAATGSRPSAGARSVWRRRCASASRS